MGHSPHLCGLRTAVCVVALVAVGARRCVSHPLAPPGSPPRSLSAVSLGGVGECEGVGFRFFRRHFARHLPCRGRQHRTAADCLQRSRLPAQYPIGGFLQENQRAHVVSRSHCRPSTALVDLLSHRVAERGDGAHQECRTARAAGHSGRLCLGGAALCRRRIPFAAPHGGRARSFLAVGARHSRHRRESGADCDALQGHAHPPTARCRSCRALVRRTGHGRNHLQSHPRRENRLHVLSHAGLSGIWPVGEWFSPPLARRDAALCTDRGLRLHGIVVCLPVVFGRFRADEQRF